MEAAIRKMKEKLTTEPSRLLNSALSHFSPPIMDRGNSHEHMDLRSQLESRQSNSATPMYRTSNLDQLDNQSPIGPGGPSPTGPGGSSQFDPQRSSPSPIDDDLEQARLEIEHLQSQLARNSVIAPHPHREVITPLFSRPSARLVDQANYWVSECEKYLGRDTVPLSIIENLLSEIKSLTRQFEALNPDKVRLEEQSELSEKYQVVRSYQMRLVNLMAEIKERNQARKNIIVLMPTFSG